MDSSSKASRVHAVPIEKFTELNQEFSITDCLSGSDAPVKSTFQDALASRWSAARKGYFKDPFVDCFGVFQNKSPMINRGTYIRTQTVDNFVYKFLNSKNLKNERYQIVSFGAGMDTRAFNLMNDNALDMEKVFYYEIDFCDIVSQKAKIILKHDELKGRLLDPVFNPSSCTLTSKNYTLFGGDLRKFSEELLPRLIDLGFDLSTPSLFIAECVFVYIEPEKVDFILNWISTNCKFAMIVSYEQVLSGSSFGKMMLSNLKLRGIKLKGLEKYPDLKSQKDRYISQGWNLAENKTIWEIEKEFLSPSEISRINRIEQLDEIEEWKLLASHYSVIVGVSDQTNEPTTAELNYFSGFTCL